MTELATVKSAAERLVALQRWQRDGGVMIMGYEMYRNFSLGHRIRDPTAKKVFHSTLVQPGQNPDTHTRTRTRTHTHTHTRTRTHKVHYGRSRTEPGEGN